MMIKQTEYGERLKKFKKARTDFEHSVNDIAKELGYSGRYIYKVLKYPNENPELFQQVADYVSKAGYPFGKKTTEANLTPTK